MYNTKSKKFFFISNSNASNGGGMNNFNINLNNAIATESGSSIDNIKKYLNPISLSIDLNYFNVSLTLKNDRISVQSNGINNSPVVVDIPDGSYSGTTLADALITALNNANITWTGGSVISWAGTAFNTNGTMTFGYSTAKPMGTTNINAAIKINFITAGGFDSKKIFGSVGDALDIPYGTGASGTIISRTTTAGIMDLVPINSLFIRSNISKSFYTFNSNNVMGYSDVLFVVNIGSNIGGTQLVEFSDDDYYQEINSNFSNLNFRITDKNNNPIQFLDGSEFNFIFAIETEVIKTNLENTNKNNIDNLRYN